MPQRRINLPFVRTALVVVAVVVCLVLGFKLKTMFGKSATDLEKMGDTVAATGPEGELKAIDYYSNALSKDPRNLRLRMKYADFLSGLARSGEEQDQFRTEATKQWYLVLQTDPTNKDALERILNSDVDAVRLAPSTYNFSEMQSVSTRVAVLNDNDSRYSPADRKAVIALKRKAKAYTNIAVISGWRIGIATTPAAIEDSLKQLKQMLDEDLASNDPSNINADVPYYLCEGYIKQAFEARASGDTDTATAKEKLAFVTFSGAFAKAPGNPALALNYFYVLRHLTTSVNDDAAQSDRKEYAQHVGEALAQARTDAKANPNDDAVLDIYQEYVMYLARKNRVRTDIAGGISPTTKTGDVTAEELLEELLKLRPNDQQARLIYASRVVNSPKLRGKAIELLERPIAESSRNTAMGPYRISKHMLQGATERELIDLLLAEYTSLTDPQQKKAIAQKVDDHYAKLVEVSPTDYTTFYTKGWIAMTLKPGKEGAIEAIPLFERAAAMVRQQRGEHHHDNPLDIRLAEAYLVAQQTGEARTQLETVVSYQPDNVWAHKRLAELLIPEARTNTRSADEVRTELRSIHDLEKDDAHNDLELQRLDSAFLMSEDPSRVNPKTVEDSLAAMPENTTDEIRAKIPFLLSASNHLNDVTRLYEVLRKRDPADVDTARSLVQIYISQNKKDQATQVVKEALAKAPDSIPLQILDAQIQEDKARIIELTKKGIETIADPVRRETSYFEFYRGMGDRAEATRHLDAAEKAAPDNTTVLDMRFSDSLENGKYADAERYLTKLAAQNADEAHGLIYRFRLAEAKKDLKGAEDVASEMVDTYPAFARSWVDYGDVLRQKGRYDDAIAKYTMALDRQAGNLESLRGIVECYMMMTPPRPDDAKNYIDQGRKLFPRDGWFKEKEVAWYLDYDPQKAIGPREEEAKAAPDKIGPQIALYAAWWELAKQQLQRGKFEEARAPMKKAHDGFAQVIAKWPGENQLEYAYFADICSQSGEYADGEKALKEMVGTPKWKDEVRPTEMLAEYYSRLGRSADAEAAWASALAVSKNAPEVCRQAAEYYLGIRKYDEALKIVDKNATDRPTQQLLIEIYMASGKLTDAQAVLDSLLRKSPDDSHLLSIKGMLLLQEDKPAEALKVLNAALAADPKNGAAYYDRGLLHMRGGQAELPDAIKDFTAARDLADSGNVSLQVQSRLSLGEALRAHGESEEAVTELTNGLRLQPGNKELRMRLIEMLGTLLSPRWGDVENYIHEAQSMPEFRTDPDWWRVEAQMWAQRKEDEKSLTAIKQALKLSAGQPQRIVPLMQDYLMVLIKLKRYPELASESGELLKSPEILKSGWWVYQARAIAEAQQNQKQQALEDYDRGLEITNRNRNDDGTMMLVQSISDNIGVDEAINRLEKQAEQSDGYHWRVIIVDLYLNKQDYPSAQAKVEELLRDIDKLQPSEKEATYVVAGLTYMMSGKYDQARTMYEKLLEVAPNDSVALNNLACIYVDDMNPPDPSKALTYSSRALDLMQKAGKVDPNVMETQGWILIRNNRLDEGINYIQTALDQRPIMEGYYHLGYGFLQKKLGLEAQMELEKAQKMIKDRKDKGQPIDPRFQSLVEDSLAKAKVLAATPTTAPGTQPVARP